MLCWHLHLCFFKGLWWHRWYSTQWPWRISPHSGCRASGCCVFRHFSSWSIFQFSMPGSATFVVNASCRGVRLSGRMFSLYRKGGTMEHMEVTKRTLRQFGLMVGGIFLFIGLWPFVWRQEAVRYWAVVPGSLLVVAGLV